MKILAKIALVWSLSCFMALPVLANEDLEYLNNLKAFNLLVQSVEMHSFETKVELLNQALNLATDQDLLDVIASGADRIQNNIDMGIYNSKEDSWKAVTKNLFSWYTNPVAYVSGIILLVDYVVTDYPAKIDRINAKYAQFKELELQ